MKRNGFGYQQTQVMGKDEWLTPPELVKALGEFDLDPCSPINRPWDTAKSHFTVQDDGLAQPWVGRVWLNPPYGDQAWTWLAKLAEHRNGLALIFARTGASGFCREVWGKAHSLLFIAGRLYFYHVSGVKWKRRLRKLGLKRTAPRDYICFRDQGRPCNCWACQKPKYNRATNRREHRVKI